MSSPRACTWVLLVVRCAVVAAGCGGSDSDDDAKDAPKPDATAQETPVTKQVTGRPLGGATDRVVIEGPEGEELEFRVRPDDAPTVSPAHVASHVGVPNL